MKRIYPFALLLLLAACQKEEKKAVVDHSKSDWAFYKLEGNVESISERSYEVKNEALDKGNPKRENSYSHDFDLFFNDEGKLVLEKKFLNGNVPHEETTYNGRDKILIVTQYMSGSPLMKTKYTWDKAGNNIGITKRNTDNSQLTRTENIFKDTLLIEENEYNLQDILTSKKQNVYDEKGNLKEELYFFKEETVQYKNKYDYDSENRKVGDTRYKKDTQDYITVFDYEGKNLVSRETTEGPDNKIVRTEKFTFDENGNLIKEYTFDSYDNSKTVDEYKYDAKNQKIARIVTENDKPVFKNTFAYDTKGNLTDVVTMNGDDTVIQSLSYKYEYDDKGNWTKKIVYKDNVPTVIVERRITYFE